MPLYEFACENQHLTEVLAPIGAPDPEACPQCGQPLERRLFAPAIRYRAGGFYSTDYATPSRPAG